MSYRLIDHYVPMCAYLFPIAIGAGEFTAPTVILIRDNQITLVVSIIAYMETIQDKLTAPTRKYQMSDCNYLIGIMGI